MEASMNKNKILREILSWVALLGVAILIVSILNSKVFTKVTVEQHSMENTLFSGQQLFVDKFTYNFREPRQGEIIIFLEYEEKGNIFDETVRLFDSVITRFEDEDLVDEIYRRLIKRVIGVPGDEIDIQDGYVLVNGKKLEEPYAVGTTMEEEVNLPIIVEEGTLFVLGDNREASTDSRSLGLIEMSHVEGKAVFRLYPFDKIGKIK
jgi:signal peptidase I